MSSAVLDNIQTQRDQAIAECHRLQAIQKAFKVALDDWLDYLATRNPKAFAALTIEDKRVLWGLVADADKTS